MSTETATEDLAEAQYDLADAIELVLEAESRTLRRPLTPSQIGRRVKADTSEVWTVLRWMVRHQYICCDDRGTWTKYWSKW